MDKDQVAAILDEIGTLLELQGENSFRCNAYHAAARSLGQVTTNLADLVRDKQLGEIPGIGTTMVEKITTLVTTGALPFYEELKAKVPPGMLDMLRLPGIGPKKIIALHKELGIDSLAKLKEACETGQVAELKGFGVKTQTKIIEGLAFVDQLGVRVRLDQALPIAEQLLAGLKKCKGIIRIELCGSLRRRRETIKDIDILASAKDAGPVMDAFVQLPGVVSVVGKGETKSSVVVAIEGRTRINADLRVVSDEQFPFAQHYFTGSKDHNIAMRSRAMDYGLKLNEYELAGKKKVRCQTEADIFKALDLDYIPPELRENTGELDAALAHTLPRLIEAGDIKGVFHCHSNWSDGNATLEQMVVAARELGLEYFGFADHSPSLTIANGLTPARVKQQHQELDELQKRHPGIRIFKGIESDILADGKLDYTDKVLDSFDYVVASVHSHFNQPEAEMTARIIKAISHPRVTMLGHATGRLLLRRDGYKVDLEAVLKTAAKHGTLIEINANPYRLDLDWIHCKRAKELGVKLVINPDAHATDEIAYYRYGVGVARRGWLEKKEVFNTQTRAEVEKALKASRERG